MKFESVNVNEIKRILMRSKLAKCNANEMHLNGLKLNWRIPNGLLRTDRSPSLSTPSSLSLQYVYKLPEGIDFDNAVALTLNYVFAHYLLFEVANLKPNQSVFIQSCAGGVVSVGLELARK